MLDVVHVHELVDALEVADRLRAELVLMEERAELIVVLRAWNLTASVGEFLMIKSYELASSSPRDTARVKRKRYLPDTPQF